MINIPQAIKLEKTIQKIPFLRLTIALAIGILIGSVISLPSPVIILSLVTVLFVLIFQNRIYKYQLVPIFGIFTKLFFILIGILVFENYNKEPIFFENGLYMASVIEKPQEKENSYKSIVKILMVKKNDSIFQTNEKILVYFEKHKNGNNLKPGDIISFKISPQFVENYGNPFEFDYKSYLSRKKIYRQLFLISDNWYKTELKPATSLTIRAEQIREYFLEIYRAQKLGKNELEILSALTLGYKRELDPETKRVFSAAGAMHVLAVSGLHVGIVFWVITILFGFLRNHKTGRFSFIIISILLLWSYAFITGLSPSVMRASTMLSIYIIGENLNRRASIYNSLAASALFLLLINPNNLFDVGFQLSYSAVFGIVYLQPKLSKLLIVKNKILKFFWSLITVSIAAQIATFPLTSFYFNQFPMYFWITNIIVIPAVMILIPMGIALLVFFKIPVLSIIISFSLNYITKGVYIILTQIEKLPQSVQEISTQPIELLFILGILFSLFLFLKNYNPKYLKMALFCTFLLSTSVLTFKTNRFSKKEIIVYNTPKNSTIQLISNKKNYIVSEFKLDENICNFIKTTNCNLRLDKPIFLTPNDTLINDRLDIINGIIFFEGKIILFDKPKNNFPKSILPDFIINPSQSDRKENNSAGSTFIITNKRYFQENSMDSKQNHYTLNQGFYRENW